MLNCAFPTHKSQMNLRRTYNYLKFLDPMDTKRSPFVSPANYGSHKFSTSMVRFIRSFPILSTYESFESRSLDLSARRYLCARLKALKSSASVCLTIWFGHRAAWINRTCVSTRQTLNWLLINCTTKCKQLEYVENNYNRLRLWDCVEKRCKCVETFRNAKLINK